MTAMGYVDSNGKDAGGEPSLNWTLALVLGIPSGLMIVIVALFLIAWWIGSARVSDRLRATATLQPAPVAVPAFAHAVESRKSLLAAEGPDLDLLIVVEAPPEMSADEVADQAADLANRLRCKLEVLYKGKKVQAKPGMSKEGFAKQSTGFFIDDGISVAIVVIFLVGLAIVFSVDWSKSRREP
jgi:hypothetical protein